MDSNFHPCLPILVLDCFLKKFETVMECLNFVQNFTFKTLMALKCARSKNYHYIKQIHEYQDKFKKEFLENSRHQNRKSKIRTRRCQKQNISTTPQ